MTSNGMPENASAKELYTKAFVLYESEKYAEVMKLYEILKTSYPDSEQTKLAAAKFVKCDPVQRVQLKTRKGYTLIIASSISAFLLLTRVESVLGHKYLVLSGNNLYDWKGKELSDETLMVLWIVIIAAFFVGISQMLDGSVKCLPLQNTEPSDGVMAETKKCPMCAELVKYEALKCKHCGFMFVD